MPHPLIIYVPPCSLVIAAILLPPMGHDLVGSMNAREFSLFLAFWWMVLALGWRVVYWLVTSLQGEPSARRGFEVIRAKPRPTAGEEPAAALDGSASRR